jgi:hypothetical protein
MTKTGLLVRFDVGPGKESDLTAFSTDALPVVDDEPQSIGWLAIRTGASSFAIVDGFPRRRSTPGASRGGWPRHGVERRACRPPPARLNATR